MKSLKYEKWLQRESSCRLHQLHGQVAHSLLARYLEFCDCHPDGAYWLWRYVYLIFCTQDESSKVSTRTASCAFSRVVISPPNKILITTELFASATQLSWVYVLLSTAIRTLSNTGCLTFWQMFWRNTLMTRYAELLSCKAALIHVCRSQYRRQCASVPATLRKRIRILGTRILNASTKTSLLLYPLFSQDLRIVRCLLLYWADVRSVTHSPSDAWFCTSPLATSSDTMIIKLLFSPQCNRIGILFDVTAIVFRQRGISNTCLTCQKKLFMCGWLAI